VPFASLPTEVVTRVVEKFVLELEMQLADRNVIIEISQPAMQWLVEQGYDPQMGARPLARIIQENIKKPLADELLFGKLKSGGVVTVGRNKQGKLTFKFSDGNSGKNPSKASEKVT
jgi:ATP-dependent Clp protease ATP-binding subunit ClpA